MLCPLSNFDPLGFQIRSTYWNHNPCLCRQVVFNSDL